MSADEETLSSKFTLGPDARWPVVRWDAPPRPDRWLDDAEILRTPAIQRTVRRLSLEGATLRNDLDENEAMYGKRWTNKRSVLGGVEPPKDAAELVSGLNKFSMKRS